MLKTHSHHTGNFLLVSVCSYSDMFNKLRQSRSKRTTILPSSYANYFLQSVKQRNRHKTQWGPANGKMSGEESGWSRRLIIHFCRFWTIIWFDSLQCFQNLIDSSWLNVTKNHLTPQYSSGVTPLLDDIISKVFQNDLKEWTLRLLRPIYSFYPSPVFHLADALVEHI